MQAGSGSVLLGAGHPQWARVPDHYDDYRCHQASGRQHLESSSRCASITNHVNAIGKMICTCLFSRLGARARLLEAVVACEDRTLFPALIGLPIASG